jgi:hypothetical protein
VLLGRCKPLITLDPLVFVYDVNYQYYIWFVFILFQILLNFQCTLNLMMKWISCTGVCHAWTPHRESGCFFLWCCGSRVGQWEAKFWFKFRRRKNVSSIMGMHDDDAFSFIYCSNYFHLLFLSDIAQCYCCFV